MKSTLLALITLIQMNIVLATPQLEDLEITAQKKLITTTFLELNNVFLPGDVGIHVFSYLPVVDLLTCAKICRNWNAIIGNDAVWRARLAQYFPLHLLHYTGEETAARERMKRLITTKASFTSIDLPIGSYASYGKAISGDGRTVGLDAYMLNKTSAAYIYTLKEGLKFLMGLEDVFKSAVSAISYDGTWIAGNIIKQREDEYTQSFIYSHEQGVKFLNAINGGTTKAHGISAPGDWIVGEATKGPEGICRAVLWSKEGKIIRTLDSIDEGNHASTYAISANGERIVGSMHRYHDCSDAFRWSSDGKIDKRLATAYGRGHVIATTISPDGSRSGDIFNSLQPHIRPAAPFWDSDGKAYDFVFLDEHNHKFSRITAINANGKIMVGTSGPDKYNSETGQAFIYSQETGMHSIKKLLEKIGVLPPVWNFKEARGISWDSTTILLNGHFFNLSTTRGLDLTCIATLPRYDILMNEGFMTKKEFVGLMAAEEL